MKRNDLIKALIPIGVIALLACLIGLGVSGLSLDRTDDIIDLGIPYSEQYSNVVEGDTSLIPWDMKLFDGKLYVSAGDYTLNTGPVGLCWYDTASGEWTKNGSVISEEAIISFSELDGVLTIPGTDACEMLGMDWDYGNYYQLIDGQWEIKRVVLHSKHVFGLRRFQDRIFAATGTIPGLSPVLVSNDNGQTFEHVPLRENGFPVVTGSYEMVRCYFMFEQENELYALIVLTDTDGRRYIVARYDSDNHIFSVIGDFQKVIQRASAVRMRNSFFTETVSWRGVNYFTNGRLFCYEDGDFVEIPALEDGIIWDMLEHEGSLYLLASFGSSEKRISVYRTDNGKDFEHVLWFRSDMYAVSFEMDDSYFYFGMANTLKPETEDTGRILAINYIEQ